MASPWRVWQHLKWAFHRSELPGSMRVYSDDVFKPLETDEELREYGFDILVDAKVIGDTRS